MTDPWQNDPDRTTRKETPMTTEELPAITHVWSTFGHTFINDDDHKSCLTCGAMYGLVRRKDDPTGGDYTAANGDDPMHCTGDTSMTHGEDVEGTHYDDCNCLLCA
jgi:hypothetical protein